MPKGRGATAGRARAPCCVTYIRALLLVLATTYMGVLLSGMWVLHRTPHTLHSDGKASDSDTCAVFPELFTRLACRVDALEQEYADGDHLVPGGMLTGLLRSSTPGGSGAETPGAGGSAGVEDVATTGGTAGPGTTTSAHHRTTRRPSQLAVPTKHSTPLIAYMFGATSRKIDAEHRNTQNLAPFIHALPSLGETTATGFRYLVVVGYDVGDVFYDSTEGWASVEAWFAANMTQACRRRGSECTLMGVRFNNTLRKPGPVFNEIARHAYEAGADYMYRLNDDTGLTSPWTEAFVSTLQGWGPPYGAVGPAHRGGNDMIMTHDFVHRTHMDIFDREYYPPELVDWWMDTWITYVYGRSRTQKIRSAKAVHATSTHGQRYHVDRANMAKLYPALGRGKRKLAEYMRAHGQPGYEKYFASANLIEGRLESAVLAFQATAGKGGQHAVQQKCRQVERQLHIVRHQSWGRATVLNRQVWEVMCASKRYDGKYFAVDLAAKHRESMPGGNFTPLRAQMNFTGTEQHDELYFVKGDLSNKSIAMVHVINLDTRTDRRRYMEAMLRNDTDLKLVSRFAGIVLTFAPNGSLVTPGSAGKSPSLSPFAREVFDGHLSTLEIPSAGGDGTSARPSPQRGAHWPWLGSHLQQANFVERHFPTATPAMRLLAGKNDSAPARYSSCTFGSPEQQLAWYSSASLPPRRLQGTAAVWLTHLSLLQQAHRTTCGGGTDDTKLVFVMEDDFRVTKRDFNRTWVPRIVAAVERLDPGWDTIRLDCATGLPMTQLGGTPYISAGRKVFRTAYLNDTPPDLQCGVTHERNSSATGGCWYAGGGYATIYRCSSIARVAQEVLRWPMNDYDGALCTRNLRNYCVNWGLVTNAPRDAVGWFSDRDPGERRG